MLRSQRLIVSAGAEIPIGARIRDASTTNAPCVRVVLCSLAMAAIVFSGVSPAKAGLWEKFWAKKHAHHNSKRGVHHNHYHHHKVHGCGHSSHKDDKHCGKASGGPCHCQHYATAPVYHPPIPAAPVYQQQAPVYQQQAAIPAYQPLAAPTYQVPIQQTLVPRPVAIQPQPAPYVPPAAPILQPPIVRWQDTSQIQYRVLPQPQTVYRQQTVYQPVVQQVSLPTPRYQLVATRFSTPPPLCYPSPNWLGFGCPPAPMIGPAPYRMQPTIVTPVIVPGPRAPVTLGREIEPLENLAPTPTFGPVPEPRGAATYGNPTPVRAALASPPTPRAAASGLFVPAPSAAAIWRARRR